MTRTQDTSIESGPDSTEDPSYVPALILIYSKDEPWRDGQVILVADPPASGEAILGRGAGAPGERRAELVQQRPGANIARPPLETPDLSKRQAKIARAPLGLGNMLVRIELIDGRKDRSVRVNGEPGNAQFAGEGDVVSIWGTDCKVAFLCTRRPRVLRAVPPGVDLHPFGWADAHGFAGESPRVWHLRAQLAAAARSEHHVLLRGDSGTGKERAAYALHRMSARAKKPLVIRSGATFNEGLAAAELFGCAADYPEPGSPAKRGLLAEAEGGTLVIDQVEKLPPQVQAMLLRVMQHRGEYNPLGASRPVRSDVWIIGVATSEEGLEKTFRSRFLTATELPGLNERREDIPAIAQELAVSYVTGKPDLEARLLAESKHFYDPEWLDYEFARFEASFVDRIVRVTYDRHAAELDGFVRTAIDESHGKTILPTAALEVKLDEQRTARLRLEDMRTQSRKRGANGRRRPAERREMTPKDEVMIRAGADGTWGWKTRLAEALGISRQMLDRWLVKLGISTGDGAEKK